MVNTLPFLEYLPAHIIMALGMLFFFLGKSIPGLKKTKPAWWFLAILVVAFFIEMAQSGSHDIFFGMLQIDSFSRLFNQIFFIVLAVTIFMVEFSNEMHKDISWENYGLLATVGFGMMLMASSSHLLMTAIGIELVSLPSYMLVALNRKNPAAKEASLKYVLFGSFATGIMLYGMSLLFGLTGALTFEKIWQGLAQPEIVGSPIYFLAIFLTLGGIFFKIAAVPFHFWTPDAYQAAPTPITAFLSSAPKVAGLALLMRFFSQTLENQTEHMTLIISVIAMMTMSLGNLAALRQNDIKRLLAYSSISHAGFLLMGIAVMTEAGRQVVFFYIPIYLLMNLGAFMAVIYISKGDEFRIDRYNGMIYKHPVLVVGLGISLLSLAGLPPFAGFIGKFYLFKVVIEKELFLLATVAAINSVVSLYFYIKILKHMILDDRKKTTLVITPNFYPVAFVTSCAIPLVFFGVYWVPLLSWANMLRLFQ